MHSKQFVKIYAQVECIMPFDNLAWEKLHWFLKFPIPKQSTVLAPIYRVRAMKTSGAIRSVLVAVFGGRDSEGATTTRGRNGSAIRR